MESLRTRIARAVDTAYSAEGSVGIGAVSGAVKIRSGLTISLHTQRKDTNSRPAASPTAPWLTGICTSLVKSRASRSETWCHVRGDGELVKSAVGLKSENNAGRKRKNAITSGAMPAP